MRIVSTKERQELKPMEDLISALNFADSQLVPKWPYMIVKRMRDKSTRTSWSERIRSTVCKLDSFEIKSLESR